MEKNTSNSTIKSFDIDLPSVGMFYVIKWVRLVVNGEQKM